MDVIILAGGLGTRLRSVINSLPKPMAPVADRPFLEYLLDYLISQKVTNKFLVSVGYEHQKIIDHFGYKYKEYELNYLIEDTPLGTGGAIRLALNKIETEQALIVNGDTLFNVNLSALINLHNQKKSLITVALKPLTDFDRYNNVLLDDDQKIIGFESKKYQDKGYINGGIYCVGKNILSSFDLPSKFSFEDDFLKVYTEKIPMYGLISDEYFIDIGIPQDYEKSQIELPELFNSRNQV
ncbi:D-glycero-alpha-D-manno-heptose 1-phosphate guanylyltransferase [Microcystis aeruginosa NIES-4325]|uniref:D-glycero-alpha-D-manno-heptose 1-phosphate guanylyltransferase n=1 Tax=Microcystis aeruginosa NIES-4325 TaxID=2569534 RepID=A0A5J4F6L9_MICAE|nr:nucleotidyltransferase family protein [Microcystis aeruginosa]GEA26589.1 D-glycero-alpha-D-manno-heptose 1-phosphate guanylyltransferase [Microcystis aeruginosa NIES-4325]